MKAALLFSLLLGVTPVLAAEPKVTSLMTKPLPDFPGKEVLMITVDYPPVAELGTFVKSEIVRLGKVVEQAGIARSQ